MRCPQIGTYDKEFQSVFDPKMGGKLPGYAMGMQGGMQGYGAPQGFGGYQPCPAPAPAPRPSLYPAAGFNPPAYSPPSYNPSEYPGSKGYPSQAPSYPAANPYSNLSFDPPPPKGGYNVPQYPGHEVRPSYPSAEAYRPPERPVYFQPPAYPSANFNPPPYHGGNQYAPPGYSKPEPHAPASNPLPYPAPSALQVSNQPNFAYPNFEEYGMHQTYPSDFPSANPRPQSPYAAPYKPENNDNYCLLCGELILGTELLVLSCLHKYHHQCLKTNITSACPVPNCEHRMTIQEKAMIAAKVVPSNVASCKICKNLIDDVKKDAAVHCTKQPGKMHKDCFISDIERQSNGMLLLTKGEAAKFKLVCAVCNGDVSEDAIKKNLVAEKFKIYKTEREQREKEEKKKLEDERKAKIKPKCCGMELNKNEFVTVLEAQGIQNPITLTSNPNPWICPLCGKAFPKASLKEIYMQDPGMTMLKAYCGSCGKKINSEIPTLSKCGHNMCSYCSSSRLPCTFCQKIK
eukprot:TRINITY_DN296_c0_g1_i10.p1 TRINITY_DN296_c0_g1~~TRINITY_DN296_c0_g1_i10.p1  ORF type:complete len:515 (-),score=92.68 TRINITY_DN296_c0_g1_i10:195-1739(-)